MKHEQFPRAKLYAQYQQPRGWTGGRLWWLPWPPKQITVNDVLMTVLALLTVAAVIGGIL